MTNTCSVNAKVDPLGQLKRAQSPSAYAAAMEEFKEAQLSNGRAREEERGEE
jgi:hypothetical protein